jgi:negative regulator of flagellin synthesis FlgM
METSKTRGAKMRIVGPFAPVVVDLEPRAAAAGPRAAPEDQRLVAASPSVLKPALDALQTEPEVNQARVEQLRQALDKGELPFNAARLAGLIAQFHEVKR